MKDYSTLRSEAEKRLENAYVGAYGTSPKEKEGGYKRSFLHFALGYNLTRIAILNRDIEILQNKINAQPENSSLH